MMIIKKETKRKENYTVRKTIKKIEIRMSQC